MKKIFLVALAGLLCLACDRAEGISVEKTVESNAEPETRASGNGTTVKKLMSKTWVLTDVKEDGNPAEDPAIGNRVVFGMNRDGERSLFFDCSENAGWTRDHTWADEDSTGWIVPSEYGDVEDMRWNVTSSGMTKKLVITNGYLLTFVQESLSGVYTIRTLSDYELIVDINSYNETWTLEFQALTFPPAGYGSDPDWEDDFDGSSISSKWRFERGGDWGADGEKELQYYCADGVFTPTQQQTAFVSGGTLKIKAYKITPKRQYKRQLGDYNYNEFISARMNTTESWTYGYYEMKAKMPTTAGCWPAFWMLVKGGNPDVTDPNAPRSGEIDIMEYVPNDQFNQVFFSAHSFAVNSSNPDSCYVSSETSEPYSYCQSGYVANPGEWHTYSMMWTHDYIQGFCDGVEYFYLPNPTPDETNLDIWPFDMNYYIKLNLAIGGGWGGAPDPNFTSATYEIDYVRVYQKNNTH